MASGLRLYRTHKVHSMADAGASDVTATVRGVAAYLSRNPDASNTLDGIARWWLDDETIPIDHVKRALDWMQARHLLKVVVAADGRLRYRRSATDAELAQALATLPLDDAALPPRP